MKKLTFLQFVNEQEDENTPSTTTRIDTMDDKELRRLSTMSPERRKAEMDRKKRKEVMSAESPRLRTLLKQKDNIEQQIAVERAKNKTGEAQP